MKSPTYAKELRYEAAIFPTADNINNFNKGLLYIYALYIVLYYIRTFSILHNNLINAEIRNVKFFILYV